MTIKIAYVAGPYRGRTPNDVATNIAAARSVAMRLWSLGYGVICPHTNSAFMSGSAPEELFLAAGLELMRRSDLVVLVPGWERSPGTLREIEEANRLGIPVFYAIDDVPMPDAPSEAYANG